MRYPVIIEWSGRNYSAYSPDVPGCIAGAETLEEVKRELASALAFHLEGLHEDGLPIPQPSTTVDYVDVEIPTQSTNEAIVSPTSTHRSS